MSRIGERVKKLRTAKGLTGKQLARSVGVTEKFIEEVEAGKKILNGDLLSRISKVLEQDMSEDNLLDPGTEGPAKTGDKKPVPKTVEKEVQKFWMDAFDAVLKAVPVYGYDLEKVIASRQLPVISNKVEGHPKDKVLFLRVQDNDMAGFRMMKGDMALGYHGGELENNAIYLLENGGQRVVRQVKRLDGDKVLLICNDGKLMTETVSIKQIKLLVKLERLEIKL